MQRSLYPYWANGTWVYDDPANGRYKEAFVAGADEVLSLALCLKGIPIGDAVNGGFELVFSDSPLPGGKGWRAKKKATRTLVGGRDLAVEYLTTSRPDPQYNYAALSVAGLTGTTYEIEELGIDGWLCPALLDFFPEPPENLYFDVRELSRPLIRKEVRVPAPKIEVRLPVVQEQPSYGKALLPADITCPIAEVSSGERKKDPAPAQAADR